MTLILEFVDNSSYEARRPAACPRDPEISINVQAYRTNKDRSGSFGQAAGRRETELSTDPNFWSILLLATEVGKRCITISFVSKRTSKARSKP